MSPNRRDGLTGSPSPSAGDPIRRDSAGFPGSGVSQTRVERLFVTLLSQERLDGLVHSLTSRQIRNVGPLA
jgi:hypothetical protein